MFINLSNHPSDCWGLKQREAAKAYGEIIDIPFPEIGPQWSLSKVKRCALEFFERCKNEIGDAKSASVIHLAGEPTFCFLLAQMLLKAEYVCLSSTTVRAKDNGSHFEFERFREYRLASFEEKNCNKRKIWKSFCDEITQNCRTYLLLIFLFFVEWVAYRAIKEPCELFWYLRYWIWGCILFGCLCTYLIRKSFRQGVSLSIMKRFLNNALGLKFLSFVFILSFLIHISWLADICLDFFVLGKGYFINIVVCLFGIFGLAIIFPIKKRGEKDINPKKRTLLVTGIREISERSLDLLLKPFDEYLNIEKIVILLSSRVLTCIDKGFKEDVEKNTETNKAANAYIKAVENYNQSVNKRIQGHIVCDKLSDFLNDKIQCLYPAYNKRKVECIFSEPVDYNDFDSCYKILRDKLKEVETTTNNTIIHISPGTAIISGVMTIFTIKGQRALIYTRQDNSELESFNIDVWTTKDLLDELWDETSSSEQ